jgi:hypothetical protein
MRFRFLKQSFNLGVVVIVLLTPGNHLIAQSYSSGDGVGLLTVSYSTSHAAEESKSSSNEAVASTSTIVAPPRVVPNIGVRPFSSIGIDSRVGIGGVGFDIATPLSRKFNLRTGSDFFIYQTSFQEQGADITANLRLRSGHASLDWFPCGGLFRLSPLVVYGNNNRVVATALVPSGSTVTLNGQDYISSPTDPLHGSGSIDFRKISPGFSVGFGNIIPRKKSHFSIPIETGFYYAGQPGLKVAFTGSACDPTEPSALGCQSVDNDMGFQQNLAAFVKRNNNNLSYASFFPIFSIGIGYKF